MFPIFFVEVTSWFLGGLLSLKSQGFFLLGSAMSFLFFKPRDSKFIWLPLLDLYGLLQSNHFVFAYLVQLFFLALDSVVYVVELRRSIRLGSAELRGRVS